MQAPLIRKSLLEIMKEEEEMKEEAEQRRLRGEVNDFQEEDEELKLALQMSLLEVEASTTEIAAAEASTTQETFEDIDEDLLLAQALSKIEAEEAALAAQENQTIERHRERLLAQNSKITVGTGFISTPNKSSVFSSDFMNAEALKRQVQSVTNIGNPDSLTSEDVNDRAIFKGGDGVMLEDGTFVSKHDPLLSSLKHTRLLSNMEGVGDLEGHCLLVGNSAANGLRQAINKLEKKKSGSS